eukprot:scaffold3586_cov404-Prasinococcus_capsulatus_cf.AAC.27
MTYECYSYMYRCAGGPLWGIPHKVDLWRVGQVLPRGTPTAALAESPLGRVPRVGDLPAQSMLSPRLGANAPKIYPVRVWVWGHRYGYSSCLGDSVTAHGPQFSKQV